MGRNIELKNNFGKKLAYLRKKRNLSQMHLAEIIDSNFNYVSQIECGRANITMNMLILLADALDVEAKELFDF
ncbi:putative restriction-modification system control element Bcll [Fusobacterium sp. CAG:439]|nr:putative restriction-modification system control element Bcll [Fusobacterium sp. CAG:439]HIT93428.1 helix-turn-helix transcriptional regulator [Candidatus Stercorousia faecigallinarum]